MAGRMLSSVRAAARVLCAFSATDRELGVSELSRRLGLSKSAVHRLLTTLAAEHLIERDARTGRYRLGIRIYELGTVVASRGELHEAAAPCIDELHVRTGETVQVGVLDGADVVYVERREAPRTLHFMVELGHRNHAHCTACGKVLLATLPEAEVERRIGAGPLTGRTPHTITDVARLRDELALIRRRGYAENVDESAIGTASVGAAIRDATGRAIAAVSVMGPTSRLDGACRARYATVVLDAAARIAERLGYRHGRMAATSH